MTWIKRTRITVLMGLLVAGAVLAWLAAHPSLYAGQVGRLITRNLLQDIGANLSFRDMRGNPFERMTFYDVVFVRTGDDREMLYVTVDSVAVRYDFRALMSREPVLDDLLLANPRVLVRRGDPDGEADEGPHPFTTIESLPRFEVGRVVIGNGSFTLAAVDGTDLHEVLGVDVTLAAQSDGESIDAWIESVVGVWPTQDIRVHTGSGHARFEPPWIHAEGFHAELDSTRVDLDLSLGFESDGEAMLDIEAEAEDFLLDEVLRLIAKDGSEVPRLRMSGSARLALRDDVMRIEGRGQGWLDNAPVSAREFVGVLDGEKLRFERVDGAYRSADGQMTGVLWTDVEPTRLELRGRVRGVDLSDRWGDEDLGWPATDLAALADVVLEFPGESVAITVDARDLRGSVEVLPVDDGHVRLQYDEASGLRVDESVVFSQSARLEVRGTVSADEMVDLFVQADVDSIDGWAAQIELPVSGERLVGAGRLIGPIDALALDAAGTVEALHWEKAHVDEGRLWIRIPDVDTPDRLRAGLSSTSLRIGVTRVGELAVELDREGNVNTIPSLVITAPDSSLWLAGRVIEEPLTDTFRIEADSLRADLGGEIWRLADPAAVEVGGNGFRTEGVELVSENGRFVLEGRVEERGELGLQLQVLDGDLSILDRIGVLPGVAGGVQGALQLRGTVDDPVVDVYVLIDDFRLGERRIRSAALTGDAEGRDVRLRELRLESTNGQADARGTITLPFDDWLARLRRDPGAVSTLWSDAEVELTVGASDLDLENWLDPAAPGGAYGRIGATLRATGPTRTPIIEGRVEVSRLPAEPFVLPWLEADVLAGPDGLEVNRGRVDLGGPDATVRARMPVYVSLVEPSRLESAEGLEVEIDTGPDLDLSTLPALWPQLRSISGRGRLVMIARGALDDPDLTGQVTIRNGAIALEGWAEELREVEIDGTFGDDQLRLTRLRGREGLNGRIEGTGTVTFDGMLPDDVALDLRAHRVLIASVPFLRAIGSSDDLKLRIERPAPDSPRAPKITGTVTVDKAIYTGEFVEQGGEPDPALLPTRAPDWLADLRIRAQDQVRISNQSAELRVAGDVTLVRDLSGLRLRGEVQIPQGRVPLFNNDFTITEGTLDFSRRPVEPEVDIRAETEVPIYDPSGTFGRELERITVHLTGTFAQPRVQFESENGLDETSILRLLAGFGPQTTDVAPAGLGDVGLRAGLNFLERALANRIRGIDTIDIETEEAGLDEMQSTRIAVGKYLSPSLYLRFSQGLSVTERDLFVEYQITRRTLFTSELKRRLRESGAENEFNLDLKFRVKY